MTKVYDTILEEILKRKRNNIPTVVLHRPKRKMRQHYYFQ